MKIAKAVKLPEINPARTVAGLPSVRSADGLKAQSFKPAAVSVGFKKLPAVFVFKLRHECCQLWPVGKVKIKALALSVGPQPLDKIVEFCVFVT